jgi:hypothetical protein
MPIIYSLSALATIAPQIRMKGMMRRPTSVIGQEKMKPAITAQSRAAAASI